MPTPAVAAPEIIDGIRAAIRTLLDLDRPDARDAQGDDYLPEQLEVADHVRRLVALGHPRALVPVLELLCEQAADGSPLWCGFRIELVSSMLQALLASDDATAVRVPLLRMLTDLRTPLDALTWSCTRSAKHPNGQHHLHTIAEAIDATTDPLRVAALVRAFSGTDDPRWRSMLDALATDGLGSPFLRSAAIGALGAHAPFSTVVGALRSPWNAVRLAAAQALNDGLDRQSWTVPNDRRSTLASLLGRLYDRAKDGCDAAVLLRALGTVDGGGEVRPRLAHAIARNNLDATVVAIGLACRTVDDDVELLDLLRPTLGKPGVMRERQVQEVLANLGAGHKDALRFHALQALGAADAATGVTPEPPGARDRRWAATTAAFALLGAIDPSLQRGCARDLLQRAAERSAQRHHDVDLAWECVSVLHAAGKTEHDLPLMELVRSQLSGDHPLREPLDAAIDAVASRAAVEQLTGALIMDLHEALRSPTTSKLALDHDLPVAAMLTAAAFALHRHGEPIGDDLVHFIRHLDESDDGTSRDSPAHQAVLLLASHGLRYELELVAADEGLPLHVRAHAASSTCLELADRHQPPGASWFTDAFGSKAGGLVQPPEPSPISAFGERLPPSALPSLTSRLRTARRRRRIERAQEPAPGTPKPAPPHRERRRPRPPGGTEL